MGNQMIDGYQIPFIDKIIKGLKAKYESVGKLNHDIIKVVHRGKYGFFNIKGEQVIPFEYDWASSFIRIKLYGKTYIGAYASQGDYKAIIDMAKNNIIAPMKRDTMYYIINDKLWVKGEEGYNLISRKGKRLLSNDYDFIVNDRFRQPKNVYLVGKNGKYGAIYISHNNKESNILPLTFENLAFWYAPTLGTFLKATHNGGHGLYKLDGNIAVPCRYDKFDFLTPFRKGFILASDKDGFALYDGVRGIPLSVSRCFMDVRYAFCWKDVSYYTIHSVDQELLINKNGEIVFSIDKKQDISCFHYLMSLQKESFKFKSLDDLLCYCQKIKKGKQKLTTSVKSDLAVYGYYFLEEEVHKYATMHQFEYTRCTLHNLLADKKQTWGTCDIYERVISLNLNLLFTSARNIRMIVLHELVHLLNVSHDRAFYRTLNELFGSDTRKIRLPQINILDTVDTVGIIKRKIRELFAMAEQKGLYASSEVYNQSNVVYSNNSSNNDYHMAAFEK